MTTNSKSKSVIVELAALLEDDEDRLRILFQEFLWALLKQEMTMAAASQPMVHTHDEAVRLATDHFGVEVLPARSGQARQAGCAMVD